MNVRSFTGCEPGETVMGHANTQVLIIVYSRFVPNLIPQDGRAITGLLNFRSGGSAPVEPCAVQPEFFQTQPRPAQSDGPHSGHRVQGGQPCRMTMIRASRN